MYEINHFVNLKKNLSPVIIEHKGRYSISSSIPEALTREVKSGFSKTRVSKVWDTEAEVIAALLAEGVTKFQLSDCSWYQA